MLNKRTVRAARVRFVEALYKRQAINGLLLGMDIARTISKRTGVPVAAILAFGAGVDEDLRMVSAEEVD